MAKNLPKNWPPTLRYLTAPDYDAGVTREQRQLLATRDSDLPLFGADAAKLPCPLVKITPISDPRHPACGQAGLFATRALKPGTPVLLYLGHVHPGSVGAGVSDREGETTVELGDTNNQDDLNRADKGPSDNGRTGSDQGKDHPPNSIHPAVAPSPPSDYDLWLHHDADIAVDADAMGNEARFINDYRGIGTRPNAEFREVWSERHRQRCMAVFVLPAGTSKGKTGSAKTGNGKQRVDDGKVKSSAMKFTGVAKGEELLVSYGKGFWKERAGEQT